MGIMVPTWFLSMWMSNTATTLLMLTITEAMLDRIDDVTAGKFQSISPTSNLLQTKQP